MKKINIFWHRRDLRLHDNAGLYQALQAGLPVIPLFIFDTHILDKLENPKDARVEFIHDEVARLKSRLEEEGSSMLVKYGKPEEVWREILATYEVKAVYTNRDYEPYARKRDAAIQNILAEKEIPFQTFKDHVIFEEKEVVKKDGDPYTVFTPYSRRWKERLESQFDEKGSFEAFKPYPSEDYIQRFLETDPLTMPGLEEMGFERTEIPIPDRSVKQGVIRHYGENRNFPAKNGTSRLGIHFRFGTISIREKAAKALELSDTYLNELIWRDFYAQILANFPHVAEGPFRPEYANIQWRNKEEEFQKWCAGKTGYPIVDAGMRELNQSGYMHNRVRMITASFLTKHLLIDWRWGEAYFAAKLLDYDLASNNGGWQWAAGCGTDAAPYFRIFNPSSQMEKFDKEKRYIRQWVPEYGTDDYPEPIVEHKFARERCLERYKEALKK